MTITMTTTTTHDLLEEEMMTTTTRGLPEEADMTTTTADSVKETEAEKLTSDSISPTTTLTTISVRGKDLYRTPPTPMPHHEPHPSHAAAVPNRNST